MLYQSYQKKLSGWKTIFDRIWHFRLLILIIIVLILATIASLMGITGMVYGEACPTSISYGEHISPSAKAIMRRETSYQYRKQGETEWSDVEPLTVGKYELRAVSKSVVGSYIYGDIFKYEIFPVKTEVASSSTQLIYGNTPEFNAYLKFGDTFTVADFDCDYTSTTSCLITPHIEGIRVLSDDGEDVTDCYEFTPLQRNVTIVPRPITIQTQSAEWIYDGEGHRYTGLAVTSDYKPLDGHTIEIPESVFVDAKNVGEYQNYISGVSIFDGDENVTEFYKIDYDYGTLAVTQRPVTLESLSKMWTYDGSEHSCADFTTHKASDKFSGIVDGHTIQVKTMTKITDVIGEDETEGSCDNVLTYTITDSEGVDVTENYNINAICGNLTILRKELTSKTGNLSEIYDGTSKSNTQITLYGENDEHCLIEGHTFDPEITNNDSITNVGSIENNVEYIPHMYAGTTEVTNNYKIVKEEYGTLTVTKRAVTLKTVSHKWTYDGLPHSDNTLEDIKDAQFKLVGGHNAIGVSASPTSITTVSSVSNSYSFTPQVSGADGSDLTSNYDITVSKEHGTLEIIKRPITVSTKTGSWLYDGKEHILKEVEVISSLGIAEGEVMTPTFTGDDVKVKDVIWNGEASGKVGSKENRVEFEVKITSNGTDVTSNYDITETYGTLTVNPRYITIDYLTPDWVYDGTEHTLNVENTDYKFTGDGFAEGQTYTATYPHIKDVKIGHDKTEEAYENKLDNFKVIISSNTISHNSSDYNGKTDVTSNYVIINNASSVTVKFRPITLKTIDDSFVYDGKEHSYETLDKDYFIEGNGLANNQTLATEHTTVKDVKFENDNKVNGKVIGYQNKLSNYKVLDANSSDVTNNYKITEAFGTVTVNRRPIHFTSDSKSWEYDGETHDEKSFKFDATTDNSGLAEGHHEYLSSYITITDVVGTDTKEGSLENVMTFEIFDGSIYYENDHANVTANYDITVTYGTLTITRRPVNATTGSFEKIYDGIQYSNQSVTLSNLVSGHTYNFSVTKAPTIGEVGQIVNELTFTFQIFRPTNDLSTSKIDVTNNYKLDTVTNGVLKITERPISVLTGSGSWEYDGYPHTEPTLSINNIDTKLYDLVKGHTMRAVGTPTEIINAETINNQYDFEVMIVDAGGKDVTSNYKVTSTHYGSLTITKRQITVTTKSDSWVYDGTEHYNTGYDVTSETKLADNQTISNDNITPVNIKYKGSKENNLQLANLLHIKNSKNEDVTKNYEITIAYGTLKITSRPITIKTGTESYVYNGKEQKKEEYTVTSNLKIVEGQKIEIVYRSEKNVKFGAGNVVEGYDNTVTVHIYENDTEKKDVTENYDISYEYGKLTITQRPITFTTEGGTWTYDGNDHSNENYSCDNLVKDLHTIVCDHPSVRNVKIEDDGSVGSYDNELLNLAIMDEEKQNVTVNYLITNHYGKLKINKRNLTVQSADSNWIYDGTAHRDDYGKITSAFDQIVNGQTHTEVYKDFIEVNTYNNEVVMTIFEAGTDVTYNYEIEYTSGTVTIKIRPIKIEEKSTVFVTFDEENSHVTFDKKGEAFDVAETIDNDNMGLANNQTISATGKVIDGITDSETEAQAVENELKFTIKDNGKDVTSNYKITETNKGKIRVKLGIIVEVWGLETQYDGKEHKLESDEYSVIQKPPEVKDDDIEVHFSGQLTEVGTKTFSELSKNWTAEVKNQQAQIEGVENKNEIRFEGDDELLKITQRKIIVSSDSISVNKKNATEGIKGSSGENGGAKITSGSLVGGHRIEITVTGFLSLEVDFTYNTIGEVKIYDKQNRDVTRNYDIEKHEGVLSWI